MWHSIPLFAIYVENKLEFVPKFAVAKEIVQEDVGKCGEIYLSFCEVKRAGEFCSLCYTQVLLLSEFLLQTEELLCREGSSGFPVGFVFPQIAFQLWRLAIVGFCNKRGEGDR